MIPRISQWLVLLLLAACGIMVAVLLHASLQAHHRLEAPLISTVPLNQAPDQPQSTATLMMPDDTTGILNPTPQPLTLPQDPASRARAILEQLIADWRVPGSLHPIHSSAGVDSVFLLPIPNHPDQQLAIVNFDAAFPLAQPSGIEPETLTLLSIIQTLHANNPSITQVRFIVNGQSRATLAGHADLSRTYLADITVSGPQS